MNFGRASGGSQSGIWIRGLLHGSGTLSLFLMLTLFGATYASGESCRGYDEFRKPGHMKLGVSIELTNPLIRQQFERAMDFWAGVVDMEWHRDDLPGCAIRVSCERSERFEADDFAQADDPDSDTFRGEIVFNSALNLTASEAFLLSIHEIGHLLGLDHNPNPTSVMYAVGFDGAEGLDAIDVAALSARHSMRPAQTTAAYPLPALRATAGIGSATATAKESNARFSPVSESAAEKQ